MPGTLNGSAINTRTINGAPVPGTETADAFVVVDVVAVARRRVAAASASGIALGAAARIGRRVPIQAAAALRMQVTAYPIAGEDDFRNLIEADASIGATITANLTFRRMTDAPRFRRMAVAKQHLRCDAEGSS